MKKVISLVLGLVLGGISFLPQTAAQPANVSVSVEVKQSAPTIDWTKGGDSDIVALGIGLPDQRGMALAREAAILAAQRNLLGTIRGVQIDADTLMENLLMTNDTVKRKISGVLRGAKIIEEGTYADGSYYVKMRAPLYGSTDSLAAAAFGGINAAREAFQKVENTKLTEEEINAVKEANYTGVVIDASGMGLDPTFSPVIYDENGRTVYGVKNIDADLAVKEGMVGYADDLSIVQNGTRAGDNPLIVKATTVKSGTVNNNKVNVVVSEEDADKMLIANEETGMMNECDVIFVK